MGFREGAYAHVWEVNQRTPRITSVRISISKKNKETGAYDTDFSGFVSVVGSEPAARALELKEGMNIKLGSVDVTNSYNKETRKSYTNFVVFDFEVQESKGGGTGSGGTKSAKPASTKPPVQEEDDEDLPF